MGRLNGTVSITGLPPYRGLIVNIHFCEVYQAMRPNWRIFMLVPLLACLIFIIMADVAFARIKTPTMEELVDSADLIVIGKVESVSATPTEFRRKAGLAVIVLVGTSLSLVLLWRRQLRDAVVVVVFCFVLGSMWSDVPSGTFRKMASVSVSSTIKGTPPPADIAVYYDERFVCDLTQFTSGEECLLFLKGVPTGYTVSWYDWSRWAINDGYARTVRRDPIAVTQLIATIQDICDKQEKRNATAPTAR